MSCHLWPAASRNLNKDTILLLSTAEDHHPSVMKRAQHMQCATETHGLQAARLCSRTALTMAVVSPAPLLLDSLSPARSPALAVLSSKPLIDQRSNMMGVADATSHLMLSRKTDTNEIDSNALQKDLPGVFAPTCITKWMPANDWISFRNYGVERPNRLLYRSPACSLCIPVPALYVLIHSVGAKCGFQ